jgi:hypothetical protein
MYYKFGLFLSMIILFSLSGCRGTVKLIDKYRTEEGAVRFYIENKEKSKSDVKRLYASVNNRRTRIYYNFCSEEIVMTTEKAKQLTYTVFHGQLPINYDTNVYRKYSNLDLVILTRGDKLLDSLGLDNFKKTHGTEAYQIEVNYYHGYPKGKRFGLENCR